MTRTAMTSSPSVHAFTSLVVGAEGTIGSTLAQSLEASGHDVWRTSRRASHSRPRQLLFDMQTDAPQFQPPAGVQAAFLCAAVTSIEQCRLEPQATRTINVDQTVTLAKRLVDRGVFVVFLSTNQVFDGSRPHMPAAAVCSPVTEYGRQKADAERQLLALGESVAVVRLTKVLGPRVTLFEQWIEQWDRGESIRPFRDMFIAPISLRCVADVLETIARRRLPGVWQISSPDQVNYEQIARLLAHRKGLDESRVQPIAAATMSIPPEQTPTHVTLDSSRLQRELNLQPANAWSVIEAVLP